VLFEKGAFTITIQLGKNQLPKLHEKLSAFSPKTNELWKNRYPCGEGGWIHYRVLDQEDLNEIKELIIIKRKPIVTIQVSLKGPNFFRNGENCI